MSETNPLRPIPPDRFDERCARHLLLRAGFGGDPGQVAYLASLGLQGAVDYLVDYQKVDDSDLPRARIDPDIISPPDREERMMFARARQERDEAALAEIMRKRNEREARDRAQFGALSQWWLARMIQTPRPLEEKLTLLWHSHFASNFRIVQDSYLLYRQNEFFRENASGSFAALAYGIVRDPAMIAFLDNNTNRAGRPNENLARELMELFTLGEGNYTEGDIREGARALTGNMYEDNDFVFRPRAHDAGEKTILRRTGRLDGEAFVRILLGQPECARFVATKLYKHFVADFTGQPQGTAKAMIERMAGMLRGNDYAMSPVLKALFKSDHFHSREVIGAKIRSPAELVVGTIRSLRTPVRDIALLSQAMGMMGQALFNPPSVAGWDGGRSWINTSTLFVRQNVCNYLITGKLPFEDGWTADDIAYDPGALLEERERQSPTQAVERLMTIMLAAAPSQERRALFMKFLEERPRGVTRDALIGLALLISASPEYQMC